ncbi:MAG: hypothetical protein Q9M21_06175 [Mariprofundaceae bacterium]|nr:hypothetical protein [Mariprofundaceae bacterium]
MKKYIILTATSLFLFTGCANAEHPMDDDMMKKDTMMHDKKMMKDDNMMKKDAMMHDKKVMKNDSMMKKDAMMGDKKMMN